MKWKKKTFLIKKNFSNKKSFSNGRKNKTYLKIIIFKNWIFYKYILRLKYIFLGRPKDTLNLKKKAQIPALKYIFFDKKKIQVYEHFLVPH